jgi:hypothetical protein
VWNADSLEVAAIITKDGNKVKELPMKYTGEKSQFAASFTPPGPGVYQAIVYGYFSATGNTGLDKVTFIVKKPKKK